MLLLLLKVSVSPVKRPLMLTAAESRFVLSKSPAVALESTATGVLCSDAGLVALSVKVAFATGVSASVGALSIDIPPGAGSIVPPL